MCLWMCSWMCSAPKRTRNFAIEGSSRRHEDTQPPCNMMPRVAAISLDRWVSDLSLSQLSARWDLDERSPDVAAEKRAWKADLCGGGGRQFAGPFMGCGEGCD